MKSLREWFRTAEDRREGFADLAYDINRDDACPNGPPSVIRAYLVKHGGDWVGRVFDEAVSAFEQEHGAHDLGRGRWGKVWWI